MKPTTSKNGRFRIEYGVRSDDSYMHSDTSESWNVISVETGEEVASFAGSWNADASGDRKSGTRDVVFNDDESAVLARGYNGRTKRVALPIAFRLSDDERSLISVYADGREKRTKLCPSLEAYDDVGEPLRSKLLKEDKKRIARIKRKLKKLKNVRV